MHQLLCRKTGEVRLDSRLVRRVDRMSQAGARGLEPVIFHVADLPARVEMLKKAGVHFRNQMEVGSGGKQIQIQMEDPDGNPIELFEPARDCLPILTES